MTDNLGDSSESNMAEWISQFPNQAKIIRNPRITHLFKQAPPPRNGEEDISWQALKKMLE